MRQAPLAIAILLAGLLTITPGRAQPPAATGERPGVQEFVFFTADGPIRVRTAVTLGGKPAVEPWQAGLDALFTHCDRTGDGLLAADERALFRTGDRRGQLLLIDGGYYTGSRMPSVSFTERDGKVDRNSFRDGFANAGLGPLSFAPVAARRDSQALTDALFKKLDADKDGQLSTEELKAARTRLAPTDRDEDELVTADEILNRLRNPFYGDIDAIELEYDIASSYDGFRRRRPAPSLPDVFVPAVGTAVGAKDLLAARDKDKDGALTLAELGGAAARFAALDADGDGRLDTDEIAAWLRSPPDLDLTFNLTNPRPTRLWLTGTTVPRMASAGTVSASPKGRLADRAKVEEAGTATAAVGDARLNFHANAAAGEQARAQWEGMMNGLRSAFTMLAGEAGAVDRQQLIDSPELGGYIVIFDFADRDKDKRLTAAELGAAARAGEAALNCRARIEVADLGRGLFELLDRDRDGALSPRELNAAAGLLKPLDRDADGQIAPTEIPRGYSITAKPASIDVLPGSGYAFDTGFIGYSSGRVERMSSTGAPEWFRHADRNGDGDVSAREFPGSPSLFRQMDLDGDGLISPEEARAFEQKPPKR